MLRLELRASIPVRPQAQKEITIFSWQENKQAENRIYTIERGNTSDKS